MLEVVEGANEDEYHLLVEAGDVVPHHEDDSSKLTSNRDSVLGVHFLLLVSRASCHQIPIDDSRFYAAGKLNEDLTIGECRVCEACQRSLWLNSLIRPG